MTTGKAACRPRNEERVAGRSPASGQPRQPWTLTSIQPWPPPRPWPPPPAIGVSPATDTKPETDTMPVTDNTLASRGHQAADRHQASHGRHRASRRHRASHSCRVGCRARRRARTPPGSISPGDGCPRGADRPRHRAAPVPALDVAGAAFVADADGYRASWVRIQSGFVDDPRGSVTEAAGPRRADQRRRSSRPSRNASARCAAPGERRQRRHGGPA